MRKELANGADVNATDYYGQTALMMAAERNFADVAKMLIDAGASVKVEDKSGHTAWYYATKHNSSKTKKLLKEYGAKTGIQTIKHCINRTLETVVGSIVEPMQY